MCGRLVCGIGLGQDLADRPWPGMTYLYHIDYYRIVHGILSNIIEVDMLVNWVFLALSG